MNLRRTGAAVVIGLSLFAGAARGDLLTLTVNGTSDNATVKGSSLPGLVDNLINTKGKFQTFDGQAYTASLKYGGINNAIVLDANASGTDVTLRIPSTGLVKHFTGANANDVQNQIKDFLLKDGSTEYAKFLQKINEQSLLGVVDGNPRATTALMSNHAFSLFGINKPVRTDVVAPGQTAPNFSIDASAGVANNDEADETFYNLAIETGICSDRIGVTFSTIANFRDVEGSELGSLGFELGVPIAMVIPTGAYGLSWQLTPVGSVAGGASYDLAAGGTMWGIGITSSISARMDRLVFTLADQITHYEGFSMNIGDYKFDTDVSQNVVKNGVGVAYMISTNFYADGSLTYTNFLKDAAIDNYYTPSVGVNLKFSANSGFRIAYTGDFADHYTANGAELRFYLGY